MTVKYTMNLNGTHICETMQRKLPSNPDTPKSGAFQRIYNPIKERIRGCILKLFRIDI